MTLSEVMTILASLSHADKLRALHFLAQELAREADVALANDAPLPVWTPYDDYDAAQALLDALETDQDRAEN